MYEPLTEEWIEARNAYEIECLEKEIPEKFGISRKDALKIRDKAISKLTPLELDLIRMPLV